VSGALFAFTASFDDVLVALFSTGPQQFTLLRQLFAGLRVLKFLRSRSRLTAKNRDRTRDGGLEQQSDAGPPGSFHHCRGCHDDDDCYCHYGDIGSDATATLARADPAESE